MDLLNIIKSRRSIMPIQYNSKPLDDNKINQILEAANWAPTHKRTEPWRYKIFKGKKKEDLGEFLSKKYKETNCL